MVITCRDVEEGKEMSFGSQCTTEFGCGLFGVLLLTNILWISMMCPGNWSGQIIPICQGICGVTPPHWEPRLCLADDPENFFLPGVFQVPALTLWLILSILKLDSINYNPPLWVWEKENTRVKAVLRSQLLLSHVGKVRCRCNRGLFSSLRTMLEWLNPSDSVYPGRRQDGLVRIAAMTNSTGISETCCKKFIPCFHKPQCGSSWSGGPVWPLSFNKTMQRFKLLTSSDSSKPLEHCTR